MSDRAEQMAPAPEERRDAVVIGAGPAGLAAAAELRARGNLREIGIDARRIARAISRRPR